MSHFFCGEPYLFKKTDAPKSLAVYGWSRYLCWVIIAGAYFSAGFSKIRNGGIWWWHGTNLKNIVLSDTLNPMHFEWGLERLLASVPIEIFSLMGLTAVFVESVYPLVLFSKRARLILPLVAIGMHLGIWICQGILFFDLILIQALFYNMVPWRKDVAAEPHVLDDNNQLQSLQKKCFSVCLVVMFGIFMCWAGRIEWYPATAWQMYSRTRNSDVITYHKVLAVYSDGHTEEAHLEKWIGAYADARYRDVFNKDPKDQRAFFDAVIKLTAQNEQIVRFEVQTRQWNFIADPNDPNFGSVTSVVNYP